MKIANGGNTVNAGFWWNKAEWQITVLSGEGGTLPGDSGTHFVRIPVLAMLTVAPIMGALYVMFLPMIGFALLAQHLGKKVAAGTKSVASETVATVGSEVRHGESYFTGRPKAETKTESTEPKSDEKPTTK